MIKLKFCNFYFRNLDSSTNEIPDISKQKRLMMVSRERAYI